MSDKKAELRKLMEAFNTMYAHGVTEIHCHERGIKQMTKLFENVFTAADDRSIWTDDVKGSIMGIQIKQVKEKNQATS